METLACMKMEEVRSGFMIFFNSYQLLKVSNVLLQLCEVLCSAVQSELWQEPRES